MSQNPDNVVNPSTVNVADQGDGPLSVDQPVTVRPSYNPRTARTVGIWCSRDGTGLARPAGHRGTVLQPRTARAGGVGRSRPGSGQPRAAGDVGSSQEHPRQLLQERARTAARRPARPSHTPQADMAGRVSTGRPPTLRSEKTMRRKLDDTSDTCIGDERGLAPGQDQQGHTTGHSLTWATDSLTHLPARWPWRPSTTFCFTRAHRPTPARAQSIKKTSSADSNQALHQEIERRSASPENPGLPVRTSQPTYLTKPGTASSWTRDAPDRSLSSPRRP